MKIDKVIRVGVVPVNDRLGSNLYAKIKYDGTRLSISGVVGPLKNGHCQGGCGQIIFELKEYGQEGFYTLSDVRPAPNWTPEMIKQFFDAWNEWHLNDLQAACEHQRELGWTYEEHHDPKTHKGELCPVCGYSIGSAWLSKEVPGEVLDFLNSLPDTDQQPAWV